MTGIVSRSGDWLDSVERVLTGALVQRGGVKLYQLNIDAEEQARMQETLTSLSSWPRSHN